MQENWRVFLQQQNAAIDGWVEHFGDLSDELQFAQTGAVLTDLSQYGLLSFSGEDAESFLQSQLSCDVSNMEHSRVQYGSYCSPQGRVLASFIVMRRENEWLMQLSSDLCASIHKRLSMFVLRSKVNIVDRSNDWIRFAVIGENARELVEAITERAVSEPMSVIHTAPVSIICHAHDRFELMALEPEAQRLWRLLSEKARPVGAACWRLREIYEGIPVITANTQEQFLPQMINLDLIGGVSFNKGCYPGQEIIARTRYLGKIKRRMYFANVAADGVAVNDDVFCADVQDQPCGAIVTVAPSPQGGCDVLAVLQKSSVANDAMFWQRQGGALLKINPLPYSLD